MPQLFPSNPSATMVIRSVTPDIVTMSLPFARFGLLRFGGRGTLGEYLTPLQMMAGAYHSEARTWTETGIELTPPCMRQSSSPRVLSPCSPLSASPPKSVRQSSRSAGM